jgi:hypothetical protein
MPDKNGIPLPGEPGYDPWNGAEIGDSATFAKKGEAFFGNVGKSLAGQKQSGTGHGFENAVADASNWVQTNKDALMGVYHPNNVQVGAGGQNGSAVSSGPAAQSGLSQSAFVGADGIEQSQSRGAQMGLIQQLQDQAAGRGPSLAQMQLQRGTDQNMQSAMAMGQSQRGGGRGGTNKAIMSQQANIQQGMAGDSAMLAMQEQLAARNALGQQLGGIRGQDQGWAQANAQAGNQSNQFNSGQSNQMGQFNAGQTNNQNQFNAGQQNSMTNSNSQRQADAANNQAKMDLEYEKMKQEAAKQGSPMGLIGGAIAAFSDERLKTNVQSGETKLYSFLDKLGSHEYDYKDKKHGDHRISPMAQELETSEAGKEFVFETKEGKAVDYGKGFGTMLASQAALHKRLKKLEGGE